MYRTDIKILSKASKVVSQTLFRRSPEDWLTAMNPLPFCAKVNPPYLPTRPHAPVFKSFPPSPLQYLLHFTGRNVCCASAHHLYVTSANGIPRTTGSYQCLFSAFNIKQCGRTSEKHSFCPLYLDYSPDRIGTRIWLITVHVIPRLAISHAVCHLIKWKTMQDMLLLGSWLPFRPICPQCHDQLLWLVLVNYLLPTDMINRCNLGDFIQSTVECVIGSLLHRSNVTWLWTRLPPNRQTHLGHHRRLEAVE